MINWLLDPTAPKPTDGPFLSWLKQLSRFAMVGVSNSAVDFIVYIALTRGSIYWAQHYLVANAFAFLVANINSFVWNHRWTFHGRRGRHMLRQYLQFLLSSLIYLAWLQIGLWLAVEYGHWYDLIAKVVVTGTAALFYFTSLRHLVFRSLPEDNPPADSDQVE